MGHAGYEVYPSLTDIAEVNLSSMECGLPTQLSFSAREISDGTFFKAIEDYDPDSKRVFHQLQKYAILLTIMKLLSVNNILVIAVLKRELWLIYRIDFHYI